jgi:serine/threonine protein kinase
MVYEGFYKNDIIACKTLKNVNLSLFLNEIKIMKDLTHSNIPKYIGHCTYNNEFFIIMERCYDLDLFEYIENYFFNIEINDKKNISLQIINTLEYIHSKNIIHRDLKPENIMIDINTLHIKIIDFGLACYIDKSIKGIIGTYGYMAPEILKDELYSFSSDIYAYGMILYVLWTKSINYSNFALFFHNIPRNYKNIIRQCLYDNPNKRPSIENIKMAFIKY